MEPDSGKIKGTGNIKKKLKRDKNVMTVHVECAKRAFNVLVLSLKNCNVFSLEHSYSNTFCFSIFMNRNFSIRIHTADIILF